MSDRNGSLKSKENQVAPGKEEPSVDENNETADMMNQSREGENAKDPDGDLPEESDETASRDAQLKEHMTKIMKSGPGMAFNIAVMLLSLVSSLTYVALTYVDSAQWDDCCWGWDEKTEEEQEALILA